MVHPRARAPACAASTCPSWSSGTSSRRTRLNKEYFRRWFYWRGISRAMLYARTGLDMEAPEQSHARLLAPCRTSSACRATSIARRSAASVAWLRDRSAGARVEAFEHELWLWFFAGIVRQRFRDPVPGGAGYTQGRRQGPDDRDQRAHRRTRDRAGNGAAGRRDGI